MARVSGVFLELMRRSETVYYWKSKKGWEVDFIIRQGIDVSEVIQVSFLLRLMLIAGQTNRAFLYAGVSGNKTNHP